MQTSDDSVAWISQARQAIRDANADFFAVSPLRYWVDFLVSMLAAYAATGIDLISTSAPMTRSRWLDLSMRFES